MKGFNAYGFFDNEKRAKVYEKAKDYTLGTIDKNVLVEDPAHIDDDSFDEES